MSEPNNRLLLPHGGYEKLRSYKVSEVVYDATVVFCARFIEKRSRTHDQMVQAARSGVRNISEGSGAAATSRKTEIKLTNVARASLSDELAKDFKSFLIQSFILAVSPASKSGKGISGTRRIYREAICIADGSKKV
jgi:four helix bundle protein